MKQVKLKNKIGLLLMKRLVLPLLLLLLPMLAYSQNKYEDILNDSQINLNKKQKNIVNGCMRRYDNQADPLRKKINEYNKLIVQEIRKANYKKLNKDLLKKLIFEKKQIEAELEYVMLILDIEILSELTEEQLSAVRKRYMRLEENGNHGSGSKHRRRMGRSNKSQND